MATILGTLVIGLAVGAIAKLLIPGRDPGGCLITILLGIAGAFVAGFLGRAIGWYEPGQPVGFIASIIGHVTFARIPVDQGPAIVARESAQFVCGASWPMRW